jgi:hypothetical protein
MHMEVSRVHAGGRLSLKLFMHAHPVQQCFERQSIIHRCVQVMTTMYLASLPRGRAKHQAQVGGKHVQQQQLRGHRIILVWAGHVDSSQCVHLQDLVTASG